MLKKSVVVIDHYTDDHLHEVQEDHDEDVLVVLVLLRVAAFPLALFFGLCSSPICSSFGAILCGV